MKMLERLKFLVYMLPFFAVFANASSNMRETVQKETIAWINVGKNIAFGLAFLVGVGVLIFGIIGFTKKEQAGGDKVQALIAVIVGAILICVPAIMVVLNLTQSKEDVGSLDISSDFK